MIKAAFFDIDGTLVSFKTHKMPESTVYALNELKSQGYKIFISSGRHRMSMNNLSGIEFDGYVTVNGAMCLASSQYAKGGYPTIHIDGKDYEMIHLDAMDKDDVFRHIDYCESKSLSCAPICLETIGINRITDAASEVFELIKFPVPEIVDIRKLAESTEVCQLISFVTADIEQEALSGMPNSHAERWHPSFVDVIAAGVNKKVGIVRILEHFGLKPDECIAIGDGGNDIDMLRFIPHSVAMGNASDIVKANASYVTDHIDNDGVLKALRHFSLSL